MLSKSLLVSLCLLLSLPLAAQKAQQAKQSTLAYFGAQIGNDLDVTATSCYIGTAGTLVTDGINDYILSNSHVLAREGEGVVGENIMHSLPTLCDSSAVHVGELAAHVPLQFGRNSNNLVDAAVARITGNVKPVLKDGKVQHIDTLVNYTDAFAVSPTPVAPLPTLKVKKSGRTTGLTRAAISQIGVNVVVRYNGGRAYFTNQFVVSSSGFSAGGDSGSLIVTDDDNANPVGLLFAGSSSSTIGNPIDTVLSELTAALGAPQLLVVGSSGDAGVDELIPDGGGNDGSGGNGGGKKEKGGGGGRPFAGDAGQPHGIAKALAVRDRNEARFLDQDGILGSGIGISNGTPNITVFVNREVPGAARRLPGSIEGIPVVIEMTDEFVAF